MALHFQQIVNAASDKAPPALTTGLIIFLTVILVLEMEYNFIAAVELTPNSLFELNLTQLSFYPFIHYNFFHFFTNLLSLVPLVYFFEKQNGTIFTGVVLNVLTVLTAIVYCFAAHVIGIKNPVGGSSGLVFSFLGYFAYKDYLVDPRTPLFSHQVSIPSFLRPVLLLILTTLVFPNSSFLGHSVGLAMGFLLGMGYLNGFVEPASDVILWIESRITPVIQVLGRIVEWIPESQAVNTRSTQNLLPTSETQVIKPEEPSLSTATGPGNTLGTS